MTYRNNDALKSTLKKIEENPDFRFHSNWHEERHNQAIRDRYEAQKEENAVGLKAALIFVPIFVVVVALLGGS